MPGERLLDKGKVFLLFLNGCIIYVLHLGNISPTNIND